MKNELFRENLIEAFRAKRKKYMSKRWRVLCSLSWFYRSFGNTKEYDRLLNSESSFQEKCYKWISGLIDLQEITHEMVEDRLYEIKSFQERLEGRNVFLFIFLGLLTVFLSLLGILSNFESTIPMYVFAIIIITFGVLVLLERHYVMEHKNICSELIVILEKWLKRNES